MRIKLKRGNDQTVTMTGLRTTAKPPIYLNTATATATLLNSRGEAVAPFNEVTMTYVAGSNGNYEWKLEGADTLPLSKSVEYQLVIAAVQDGLDYRTTHEVSVVDGD